MVDSFKILLPFHLFCCVDNVFIFYSPSLSLRVCARICFPHQIILMAEVPRSLLNVCTMHVLRIVSNTERTENFRFVITDVSLLFAVSTKRLFDICWCRISINCSAKCVCVSFFYQSNDNRFERCAFWLWFKHYHYMQLMIWVKTSNQSVSFTSDFISYKSKIYNAIQSSENNEKLHVDDFLTSLSLPKETTSLNSGIHFNA